VSKGLYLLKAKDPKGNNLKPIKLVLNKFIFIFFIFISITLRESFSQCLLFNEIKSSYAFNEYFGSVQLNNYFYFVGSGSEIEDETIPWYDSNPNDGLIVKTDSCGNIIWKKTIDSTHDLFPFQILSFDKFLYVLGMTSRGGRWTTFLSKLDENGDTLWYRDYTKVSANIGSRMFVDSDKLVLFGFRELLVGSEFSNYNPYIFSIDTNNGTVIFDKSYKDWYPLENKFDGFFNYLVKTDSNYIGLATINGPADNVIIFTLDNKFNVISKDTLLKKSVPVGWYFWFDRRFTYNSQSKKVAAFMNSLSSDKNDSNNFCFVVMDNKGKVEKTIPILEMVNDPTRVAIIPFKEGWIVSWGNGSISQYDVNFNSIKHFLLKEAYWQTFQSSFISLVNNGSAFLMTGKCKDCNANDFILDNYYYRLTAFMIDTNFIDFGKLQTPSISYNAIKAFPNPALESITLQITETEAAYSIYNSLGMFVSSGSMASSADISLLNMASGMYIIQLKSPQGINIGNVKFLKK